MALADSVPGVSGGTIAFIMGFYDDFIGALNALLGGTKEEKRQGLFYLGRLLSGWAAGLGLSVLVLGRIFDSHIYQLSSLFLGLTLFAIPVVLLEEKESLSVPFYYLLFTLLGTVIVAGITYLNQTGGGGSRVYPEHFSAAAALYVFVVAMIAISAMVLPGISGSTLLLIFGLYVPVINGIKELLHFHFTYLPMLMVFGFGVITGICAAIRLIKAGLERYRPQMIHLILGLMFGSLYAIGMGPATLEVPQPALNFSNFHILYFLAGGVLVVGLELVKKRMEKTAATAQP